jgi:hypothetical protein
MNHEMTPADDVLNGVKAIAAFTGETERRAFYLLERGMLPGKKIGSRWISSRAALRKAYSVGEAA